MRVLKKMSLLSGGAQKRWRLTEARKSGWAVAAAWAKKWPAINHLARYRRPYQPRPIGLRLGGPGPLKWQAENL